VSDGPVDQSFGRRWRVRGRTRFAEIHGAKVRRESGPLLVYALPNELDHLRIGLSVGRRVGNAVRRNLVKRRLREAFRRHRDAWATGYDLLVVVRPHDPLSPDDYAVQLGEVITRLDKAWRKRASTPKTAPPNMAPPASSDD
jgi:ribonuclease P protein component